MKKWMDEEYEGEKGRERKVELIVKERPISSVKLNKTTGGGFLKKLPPWQRVGYLSRKNLYEQNGRNNQSKPVFKLRGRAESLTNLKTALFKRKKASTLGQEEFQRAFEAKYNSPAAVAGPARAISVPKKKSELGIPISEITRTLNMNKDYNSVAERSRRQSNRATSTHTPDSGEDEIPFVILNIPPPLNRRSLKRRFSDTDTESPNSSPRAGAGPSSESPGNTLTSDGGGRRESQLGLRRGLQIPGIEITSEKGQSPSARVNEPKTGNVLLRCPTMPFGRMLTEDESNWMGDVMSGGISQDYEIRSQVDRSDSGGGSPSRKRSSQPGRLISAAPPLIGEMSESKKLIKRLERKGLTSTKNPLTEAKKKLAKIYRQLRRESSQHYLNLQREIRNESKASIKYPINKVKLKRRASEKRGDGVRKFGIMGEDEEDLEEEEFEPMPDDGWVGSNLEEAIAQLKREEEAKEKEESEFLRDVKSGDVIKVMEWLERDANLASNAIDTLGLTALHFAALKGDAFLVECILSFDHAVLFTKKDIFGRTALDVARSLNHRDVVHILELKHQGLYQQKKMFKSSSLRLKKAVSSRLILHTKSDNPFKNRIL